MHDCMESIQETPTKRRKTQTGYVANGESYDSQDDSGDNIYDHDTVATLPVQRSTLRPATPDLPASPYTYKTQPTQIAIVLQSRIGDNSGQNQSVVQVAASSPSSIPLSSPARPPDTKWQGGKLANLMAPAGTAYRPPMGVLKPKAVDFSDDEGPTYRGGSSDEEPLTSLKGNIKPSKFIQSAQAIATENAAKTRFKEITSRSFYKPLEVSAAKDQGMSLLNSAPESRNVGPLPTITHFSTASKKSLAVMENGYESASRPLKQVRPSQAAPAKAHPVEATSIDDIEDYQLRAKIIRILTVFPQNSVAICKNALIHKKGNFDDALEFLSAMDADADLDLDRSPPFSRNEKEEETSANMFEKASQAAERLPKPSAKQHVKAPVKSILERWSTNTQTISKSSQPTATNDAPPKPRRRLVQGQRHKLPSTETKSSPPRAKHVIALDSDQSDSGLGPESSDDVEREDNETKVLNFLNNCSILELVDIAAISKDHAAFLLSQKPFRNLAEARKVHTKILAKGPKRGTQQLLGDKIVDKCIDMWAGYEAVDMLVGQCEVLGKPIGEEMKKWGVDVFGAAKDGELELASFDKISGAKGTIRDSGIGTPTSDEESFNQDQNAFFPQPKMMSQKVVLKDYQIVGINWLYLLFRNNLSCILADDMGLGKTCQVIAFLARLRETGTKGPHLVVVPGSTLENWLQEFSTYCPDLTVMPYYAGIKERPEVREYIIENKDNINVIVTTYDMAKKSDDNRFIRRLKPVVCVYDEGHVLKNSKSTAYKMLMRIPAQFRLLLTGTPLQNNLTELVSLLGFILPSVFQEHSEDLEYIFRHKAKTAGDTHAALLSSQRISRAKSMMTPFVLRRKKHQVLNYLPQKTRRVEYCELNPSQRKIYEQEKAKAAQVIKDRGAGKRPNNTANIMMSLRQASIHPLLFRRLYTDEIITKMAKASINEEEFQQSNVGLVQEDMSVMTDYELHFFSEKYPATMSGFKLKNREWMDSGKVTKLCELLKNFKQNGDRVLIFSQFTMVMNILEAVLETLDITFFRLDGQTKIDERQDMIDQFYQEEDIMVFLLSTKAGGAGINLACANKVVIFDLSYNPQEDVQAENRAHRLGQKREVEVIRLVTRGTIEEQIHALGETKLALDARMAGEEPAGELTEGGKMEKKGAKAVEEMVLREIEGESMKAGAIVVEVT